MVSSLAAQLAQTASLNTSLLSDKARRKAGESYLFTGREADQHDLESIHSLAVNGFLQLAALNPAIRQFESDLFSDAAKNNDRTMQTAEQNAQLDRSIASFTRQIGPYLLEAPTGKVLEWLVRRFRINEFNVLDLLALFLPYHESPHFAKMVTILHIKENSTWSFLLAYKASAQSLPRISLVTEMLKNTDVSRFIFGLLPEALKSGSSHRALIAFNAASVHDFLIRNKSLDEGTVAYVLPSLLTPLQHKSDSHPSSKDSILGSYILLAAFSQKCQLAVDALKVIISAMTSCARRVSTHQFINALISVCEPQEQIDALPDGALKLLLRLPKFEDEICRASLWVGAEKVLMPLISSLTKRIAEDPVFSILTSIQSASKMPALITRFLTTLLVEIVVAPVLNGLIDIPARRLLATIQQRHPKIFLSVTDAISERDDESKEAVDQLIISLSMTHANKKVTVTEEHLDVIVASTNADANVRTIAVKSMLQTIAGNDTSDLEQLESALAARIQDPNVQVLESLFSEPDILTRILYKDASAYISYLASALGSLTVKPKRAFLRVHITFLLQHFCLGGKSTDNRTEEILHKIVFPFLLFSKPRQHSAQVVWEALAESGVSVGGVGACELIGGCVDTWKWEKERVGADVVETMSATNLAVASKMADNIAISSNFESHFVAILSKLGDENPHARALGYLIVRSLLGRLSGNVQLDAAHKILKAMDVEQLGGTTDLPPSAEQLHVLLHDASLGKTVVLKPTSLNTKIWLQTSVVALIPAISRPTGVPLCWIGNQNSLDVSAARYLDLMHTVYRLANAPASLPALTTNLLSALFINLKDDALAFLAGLWTHPASDEHLRLLALQHAAAFLAAHLSEEQVVDFQTVLPCLLVALQTDVGSLRSAAAECLSILSTLSSKSFTAVYGFDAIYGPGSDQLQYLDRDDYRKYITVLSDHREHLVNDPSYLIVLHTQHLTRAKGEKKKEAEYRQRVLCYLLAHITVLDLQDAQVSLLKSISNVTDSVKAEMLQDSISTLIDAKSTSEEHASLLVASFDTTTAQDLNAADGSLWNIYVLTLGYYFKSGSPSSPRTILSATLERGLFALLNPERKIDVCELLLKIGSEDIDAYPHCKKVLMSVLQDIPIITHLLNTLNPTTPDGSPKSTKRAKTTEPAETSLAQLSLLAEVLGTKSLPGSIDLISRLLDTLSRVLQYASPNQTDMSYIEQLLMSAVESAASKVADVPNLIPSAVRLDILVEVIRVAENPQTFHQALLLIASLTRLAPDSVLHNVMPVFTFMGSNVFHRDDTYSFRVVQKTIDSIVPVMVSSLKRTHADRLELYIGSRGFLRIFTDASNHIPRHRRTNFFAHLVDVLGPNDFLAPVCMLLVEKVANRIIRLGADEVQAFLALPISLLQHYPTSLQIYVLTELLRESQRLTSHASNAEDTQLTFLEPLPDEEHALPVATAFKRRSQALVRFVGYAVRSSSGPSTADIPEGGTMSELVALLIATATTQHEKAAVDDISKAAHFAMSRALTVMSATDFIKAVFAMLQSGESQVQVGAFELLAERLGSVSDRVRSEMSPIVTQIIETICVCIDATDSPATVSAYKALRAICLTTASGEETALTAIVPLVLKTIHRRKLAASAMTVLSPLTMKLGPRIIPFFRDIISESVAVIREGVADDAFSVLNGLLATIPAFWGTTELTQIVKLSIEHRAGSMPTLVKSIAKRAPTKVLLPTLYEMWPIVNADQQRTKNFDPCMTFFDLLARTLRGASRPVVMEHIRPLFKLFLEAFDVANESSPMASQAEAQAISAFRELVVKLNEAAFRPLFRKLYDWAFASESVYPSARKVTFCNVYIALLDFFKGLMNPYMSSLLQPFVDLLVLYDQSSMSDKALWLSVLETLTKSLAFDDGSFWRDDKLRQIAAPLVSQIAVCVRLNSSEGKAAVPASLNALVDRVTDDMVLKSVNLDVLMHTRSEDSRLRIFALLCSGSLWQTHGGKLLGFVPETATFIQECAEDENDVVVKESGLLKDAVEAVAGNITEL